MEYCLISKDIIENKITLPCNHSYDYIYLYLEIEQQKNKKGFICPYCRKKYDLNIPYYEIDEITISNFKQNNTLDIFKCGKCDKPAHKFNHGTFCFKHSKIINICNGICKNGKKCTKNSLKNNNYCRLHLNQKND